eukprot:TRINITY_DN17103_c0_g1_i1.p1 TRINITY_DN17103_c0_g1~~TRINITY_DN17103_c0_g1_i1.p1  ORF type:complete len:718 (-),score=170.97 TRINITY_DN17103_c0_g1_i1:234-2315(-)
MAACWNRGYKDEDDKTTASPLFLSQQLKFIRDQYNSKTMLCNELSGELRRLQVQLDQQARKYQEARNSEKAATASMEAERREYKSEIAALQCSNGMVRRKASLDRGDAANDAIAEAATTADMVGADCASAADGSPNSVGAADVAAGTRCRRPREDSSMSPRRGHEAAARAAEARVLELEVQVQATAAAAEARVLELERKVQALRKSAAESSHREAELSEALRAEQHLHEEAVRLSQMHHKDSKTLYQELIELSTALSQKEDDVLSIQFEMAQLQNRLRDQVGLVVENAAAFQTASEELADKDEALEKAQSRQEELLAAMQEVSWSLQAKIGQLTTELEGNRHSHAAMEERTRAHVIRVEKERDDVTQELTRCRSEAETTLAGLRQELRQTQAAAEQQKLELELELSVTKSSSERTERDLQMRLEDEQAKHAEAKRKISKLEVDLRNAKAEDVVTALTDENWEIKGQLSGLMNDNVRIVGELHKMEGSLVRYQLLERQANERAQEAEERLASTLTERSRSRSKQCSFTAGAPRGLEEESETCLGQMGAFAADDGVCSDDAFALGFHEPRQVWRRSATCGGGGYDATIAEVRQQQKVEDTLANIEKEDQEEDLADTVLMSVEIDIGGDRSITVTIAPWHTRNEFDKVVRSLFEENNVQPCFARAVVRYLEDLENKTETYPVRASANLDDLHERFG